MKIIFDKVFLVLWFVLIASMSISAGSRSNWFVVAWGLFLGGLVAWSMVNSHLRRRSLKRFAATHSLEFTGDLLPDGLSLLRTSFALKDFCVSNCMRGDLRSIPLAVFDVSHRKGKATLTQTVVAFRRCGNMSIPESPVDAVGAYEFEDAGGWVIGYVSKRLVRIEELEDWCVELHTLAHDLLAQANGDANASPRLFRWLA